jgi:hypothetical protein
MSKKNQPNAGSESTPTGGTDTLPETPTPEMVAAIENLFANIVPTVSQPEPAVDHVQVFADLFASVASDDSDLNGSTGPLVDAYRAIPGAGRGRAVARAMAAAMRAGSDPDRIADLSDVCTAAPPVKTVVSVDPVVTLAMRLTATRLARLTLADDSGLTPDQVATAHELADLAMSGQQTPADTDAILSAARRAVSAVSRGGSTSRGPVTARRVASAVPAGQSASRIHVDQVMAAQTPGTFLTTRQIADLPSDAYPAGSARPSAGALANVVRDRKSGSPLLGDNWTGMARPDGATRS